MHFHAPRTHRRLPNALIAFVAAPAALETEPVAFAHPFGHASTATRTLLHRVASAAKAKPAAVLELFAAEAATRLGKVLGNKFEVLVVEPLVLEDVGLPSERLRVVALARVAAASAQLGNAPNAVRFVERQELNAIKVRKLDLRRAPSGLMITETRQGKPPCAWRRVLSRLVGGGALAIRHLSYGPESARGKARRANALEAPRPGAGRGETIILFLFLRELWYFRIFFKARGRDCDPPSSGTYLCRSIKKTTTDRVFQCALVRHKRYVLLVFFDLILLRVSRTCGGVELFGGWRGDHIAFLV